MARPAFTDLLFDLDGTLSDPREGILGCIEHALDALGETSPPRVELERYIGPPLREVFARILGTTDAARIEEAVDRYRDRYTTLGVYEHVTYPGIPELLRSLHASGYRLWVATVKPHVFARRALGHIGLAGAFAGIYGAELDGARSDKAELIAHMRERERLDAAAMIGDRAGDMRAARENGLHGIGVLWGYGSREELDGAGAHATVADVAALARMLDAGPR